MFRITPLKRKDVPPALLLEADPDEEKIAAYPRETLYWGAWGEEGGELFGATAVLPAKEAWEILNLSVRPARRGKKVGCRLVEAVLDAAASAGMPRVRLKTGTTGPAPLMLYQQIGFRPIRLERDFFTRAYAGPLFEGPQFCRDMLELEYRLYSADEQKRAREAYWEAFLAEHPAYRGKSYEAWPFGWGRHMAQSLLAYTRQGRKTATCSSREMMEWEEEPLPQEGDISMILGGDGMPGCLIETREIRLKSFAEVTPEEAAMEGEDDLSLREWRRGHEAFFSREYKRMGREFHPGIPLVYERFALLFNKNWEEILSPPL